MNVKGMSPFAAQLSQLTNKTFGWARLPSSAEEGWLREVRMPRSDHSRADGVVLVRKSCIQRWLRRFLFDVAPSSAEEGNSHADTSA